MDLNVVIKELETKIIKTLEILNELRSENSKLQSENEKLRSENEKYKFTLQEKEDNIKSIIFEMEKNQDEVNQLKLKEETLEVKVSHLLEKFSDVPQTGKLSKPVGFETMEKLPEEESPVFEDSATSLDNQEEKSIYNPTDLESDPYSVSSSHYKSDEQIQEEINKLENLDTDDIIVPGLDKNDNVTST